MEEFSDHKMENTIYWLWLTNKTSLSEKEIEGLVKYYKSAKNVYDTFDFKINLSEAAKASLMNKKLDKAKLIYDEVRNMGGYILTIENNEYPPLLRNIPNPPYVLYCKGQHMDWKNMLTIAVVGTRRYSSYGKDATNHICSGLAEAGVIIVSGMARGIDSIAAWSALNNGGSTIAILGSGIDVVYPHENVGLYNTVAQNGVVITEYPPHTKPLPQNFPRRNRIIAGLSYGVLAVQAPAKSGALITAGQAIDFGRDVYAIPASIFERASEGTNRLIQQGAKAVMNANDIIEEYPYFELSTLNRAFAKDDEHTPNNHVTMNTSEQRKINEEKISHLSGTEIAIIKLLAEGNKHLDEICRKTEKSINETNACMVMLEVMGYVIKLENNTFELNREILE